MELWIKTKELPNYEVSSNGRVRNSKTGRVMKTSVSTRGYVQVCLHDNCTPYMRSVHRLVADAFYDGDHQGLEVNHIDGDKQNNFIGNLEWCTRKENTEHAFKTGLRCAPRKTKIRVIETDRTYDSILECARDINCDRSQIRKCLLGIEKTCKGYHFEHV